MRILHVGFGFTPWIVNGLVIYAENVMDAQARQGHEVGYFFAARQLPGLRRPYLHRWRRGEVAMFEWVNSPLVVGRHRGTADPEHDLDDAAAERALTRTLDAFTPDLVHVHDLGGLPSSLLGVAQQRSLPVVMTIHDYHPLCPTIKLYDAHDQVCLRSDPGAMCTVCCAAAPAANDEDLDRTLRYERKWLRRRVPGLEAALRNPMIDRVGGAGVWLSERLSRPGGAGAAAGGRPTTGRPAGADGRPAADGGAAGVAPPSAYQRRRDVNLARLGRLDALIASSERSAAVYRQLGVPGERIRRVTINPPHIERLTPRTPRPPGRPMRFAVLNAANSTQKGADLLVATLARLGDRGLDGRFRLVVHGAIADHVRPALARHPSVQLAGTYEVDELDALLETADVGLFPSVWEEVYGFAGLEFLAKGIPVIGNAIGAIPEYVRPGETGWLNQSCSAEELAGLIAGAIADPDAVERLGHELAARRRGLIRPFAAGLADLAAVYDELVRGR